MNPNRLKQYSYEELMVLKVRLRARIKHVDNTLILFHCNNRCRFTTSNDIAFKKSMYSQLTILNDDIKAIEEQLINCKIECLSTPSFN